MASKELQAVIDMFRSGQALEIANVKEYRAFVEAGGVMFPLAPDVRCEPVDAGGIKAEYISVPESDVDRIVYYLHGGGYIAGSIDSHREMVSRLARTAKARVLLIDYRLAPENPFPASVEDALAGYRWLLSTGVNPDRVIIAGDSAGGGLTMATLVALKDAGEPLPAAAVCVSPWVDLVCTGESMVTRADADPLLQHDSLIEIAGFYLWEGDQRTPLASPLYADLTGLPPLLVLVGTAEVLYDDARRLAEKAEVDGLEVVFEPWEDMIHDWTMVAAMLPEGQQVIDRIGKYVIENTGR